LSADLLTFNSFEHILGYSNSRLPQICSTQILTKEELNSNRRADVLKYGAVTKLTMGKYALNNMHVRFDSGFLHAVDYNLRSKTFTGQGFPFYNQLGIMKIGAEDFFMEGDSGSFCFIIDNRNENKIRPFGMAIGKSSSGFCIVTPLPDILKGLGLDLDNGVKLFPSTGAEASVEENGNTDEVQNPLRSIIHRFDKQDEVIGKLTSDVVNLNTELSKVKSDVRNIQSNYPNDKHVTRGEEATLMYQRNQKD